MIVLYIILASVLILAAALLINAERTAAKARKLEGQHPTFTEAQLEVYGKTFSRMLQPATVSVKGSYDDTEFAKLRRVVEEDFPLLHQKAERVILSDDCWLYKIPGRDPSRNILLMSHHDVAPVDETWTVPAFGGVIKDGKVYGRGAADTKGSLCAILFAAEEMLKKGTVPPVNFYILSSHNEELSVDGDGMPCMLEYCRKNGITFEVILDEGGAIVDPLIPGMECEKCAMVAVHEKGKMILKCTAENVSGHLTLTAFSGNPVERMTRFVQELTTKNIFIRRMHPQTRAMFTSLAPYCKLPIRLLLSNLWFFGGLLTWILPKIHPLVGGMVGTTCHFLSIEGDVNKKYCTASVLLRDVSQEDMKADYAALKAVADRYGIKLETTRDEDYPPADMESPAYRYTMECLGKVFPRYPAAPYILSAATDAWRLTPVCNCVLRFAPTRMSKQQLASIHAADENLDIAAIAEAAVFYQYFVENYR